MAWQLLVTRKDAPLRFDLGSRGVSNIGDRCNIINSPILKGLRNDKCLADETGMVHIDIDQLRSIMGALIRLSKENPRFFLDLAIHYKNVCLELLATAESIGEIKDIEALPNEKLLELFKKFCERFYEFTPILNIPFAVERGYQEPYMNMLSMLAKRIIGQLKTSDDGLSIFLFENLVNTEDIETQIQRNLRQILEFSEELTFGERKDFQMSEIAGYIQKDKNLVSIFSGENITRDSLLMVDENLVDRIDRCLEEYRWIKQWGYPPYSLPATFEDYVRELKEKLETDPIAKLEETQNEKEISKKKFNDFLNLIQLSDDELAVIETINHYNYLRTWRMEIMMKSQYLSVPFFKEIERRGIDDGKLMEDDIFFLTVPEIEVFLAEGKVPSDIRDRRKDWVFVPKNGDFIILTGKEMHEFREVFFSAINFRENAHGPYTHDNLSVGGKAANLFTLVSNGFNVPEYFVLTSKAFELFIQKNALDREIKNVFKETGLFELGKKELFDNIAKIEDAETKVKELFTKAQLPDTVKKSIENNVTELDLSHIAVRSSATLEDSQTLSWAGRFKSFVYVNKDELINKIKEVWASLYCKEALIYSIENDINLLDNSMCVIVQRMIDPEVSGVVNTVLSSQETDLMEIEAIYGQCTPIVSGELTPDRFVVQKKEYSIIRKDIATQKKSFGKQGWMDVDTKAQNLQKINDDKVVELANICNKIENTFEKPQDIEWSLENGDVYIIQSRPQTGIDKMVVESEEVEEKGELILTGLKGKLVTILRGKALILNDLKEADKVKGGEILVIPFATPAWDPILFKVAAIITNEGGATSHAIRVANEKKFPAVVGTEKATKIIRDGDEIVIDTKTDMFKGKIYRKGK